MDLSSRENPLSSFASSRVGRRPAPSVEVRLEWATYQDAADQAGQSRIFGGIHISPDDFVGRRLGHDVGLSAAARARLFFDGSAVP